MHVCVCDCVIVCVCVFVCVNIKGHKTRVSSGLISTSLLSPHMGGKDRRINVILDTMDYTANSRNGSKATWNFEPTL